MKTKFLYSGTYIFESPSGKRRHWFFNLVERFGEGASFRLTDKDNDDVIPTAIEMDGEVETATFLYYGIEYTLRADRYQPKDYPQTIDGRLEKKDDALLDAHLHTADNREEVEASQVCYCICCQTFFKPTEIDEYTDGGATAICPYCDCDAVIGDACGIPMTDELLERLHNKYFSYDDID